MFLAHGLKASAATGETPAIDEAWLRRAIEDRGGRVLDSDTPLPSDVSQSLLVNLQNQWSHWFYADALALFPDDPTVRDHVARHAWTALPSAPATNEAPDPRLRALVQALLGPVIDAYELVAAHATQSEVTPTDAVSLVRAHPATYLLHVEDAFRSFTERGVLHEVQPGRYAPTHSVAPVTKTRGSFMSSDLLNSTCRVAHWKTCAALARRSMGA